jgi:glyoxylase-like metal-dependent hydrolase (beta-lactamase superfamily II)
LEIDGGLVIGGDALTHASISFAHPEWRPQADHVPDQAIDTRKRLLDRLAADRMRLIGFHLPRSAKAALAGGFFMGFSWARRPRCLRRRRSPAPARPSP